MAEDCVHDGGGWTVEGMTATDARDVPGFARVAIVGCGLIGGSLALATRVRWPGCHVIAIDQPDVIAAATAAGAIESGSDDLAAAADADLVVLAAPVRANLDTLARLAGALHGAAVVTDVSGTKRAIVDQAAGLPARLTFVGGHPLAGAARGGVGRASADLFDGRRWILTPTPATPEMVTTALERFLAGLGARPQRMTADAHDGLLAYLSHLPQLVVSALMEVVGEQAGSAGLALAGSGLRDTTRLAASPADIWRDVVSTNRDYVTAALDRLIDALERLRADSSGASLEATFAAARRWKAALDAGDGSPDGRAIRTYVEMREPAALRAVDCPDPDVRIERLAACPPSFYRYLYAEVGRPYHWVDRSGWSDARIAAHLDDPAVSVWVLTVGHAPAGYFELKRDDEGGVEIAYLGLLDGFTGRGLGGFLVTEAARRAWDLGAARVWLHTCSLDHAAALPNYLKRGFTPFRTEEYSL